MGGLLGAFLLSLLRFCERGFKQLCMGLPAGLDFPGCPCEEVCVHVYVQIAEVKYVHVLVCLQAFLNAEYKFA